MSPQGFKEIEPIDTRARSENGPWSGARERGVKPEKISEWMSASTARLAGLAHRKGAIAEGYDADITVWDPDAAFVVQSEALLHRHHVTPYSGRELFGTIERTYVGGETVYLRGHPA